MGFTTDVIITENVGGGGGGISGSGTANELARFTDTTTIGSLTTATYPSLAELAYVKGITSAIQGQIDGKQPTINDGGLSIDKLDIDGGTDIGANLADADLMIIDDGATGTNRKSAMSRIFTYISSKITGAISSLLTSNLTVSRALVSDGSGKITVATTTSTEIGYVNGVTSAIQTQLNGKPTSVIKMKASNQSVANTNTPQNDDTLFFTAENAKYIIELYIWGYADSGAETQMRIDFDTAGGTGSFVVGEVLTNAATATILTDTSSFTTQRTIAWTTATNHFVRLICQTGTLTAGTVQFKFAPQTATGTSVLVGAGSFLRYQKV